MWRFPTLFLECLNCNHFIWAYSTQTTLQRVVLVHPLLSAQIAPLLVTLRLWIENGSWSCLTSPPGPMVYLLHQGPLSRKASSLMEGLSTLPTPFPAGQGLCAASCHMCSPEPLEVKGSRPQEVNSILQSTRTVSLNGLFSLCGWNRDFQQNSSEAIILPRRKPNY